MKECSKRIWLSVLSTAVLAVVSAGGTTVSAGDKPVLTNDDCVMCHTQEPAYIERAGAAHKTQIGCQDCHVGHPPKVREGVIPQCSMCHDGEAHFQVENCMRCHSNPHTPLELTLGKKEKAVCLTCHAEEGQQLNEHKSHHTVMACTDCHDNSAHGVVPSCLKCHKPHSPEMTGDDCHKCHKAHMPLVVTYGADTPNADCGACHNRELQLLASSPTKHHDVTCVQCHNDVHKTVPRCQKCHGEEPHAKGILSRFPSCLSCHKDPHDLNDWGSKGRKK